MKKPISKMKKFHLHCQKMTFGGFVTDRHTNSDQKSLRSFSQH